MNESATLWLNGCVYLAGVISDSKTTNMTLKVVPVWGHLSIHMLI